MSYAFETAAMNTVADFDGGARGLGERVGINGSVLAHKVSLTDKDNQLTVPQARKIMLATSDYRMLHGLAVDLGHLCIQAEGLRDGHSLEKSLSEVAKEFGEYLTAIGVAVADDDVTPNELRRIDKELSELIAAANQLRGLCALARKRNGSSRG